MISSLKSRLKSGLASLLVLAGLSSSLEANVINVSHIQDVVPAAGTQGGVSRDYATENLKVEGQDPTALILAFGYRYPTQEELIQYPGLQSDSKLFIGGLENLPGDPFTPITTATGFFNKDDANFWGFKNFGDVLGGNVPGGFFGFYDKNGDGKVGTLNTETGVLTPDTKEFINPQHIYFTGFQPFPQQNTLATIQSISITNGYVKNIHAEIAPRNSDDTQVKVGFFEFDWYADNLFTSIPGSDKSKLDAKYRITFWEDVGKDGNKDNDIMLTREDGSLVQSDNHIIFIVNNPEFYKPQDKKINPYDEYITHMFMFGIPDFTLQEEGITRIYSKIEDLEFGNPDYFQFNPAFSDYIDVYKTPDAPTLSLVGLGLAGLWASFRNKRKNN
ncbi:hypothetical protein FJZ19_02980 [Candidatus Pacearchaeota archaeon]|nr:hypothetical protein [Candidatus Pacearchaeota archaeon]